MKRGSQVVFKRVSVHQEEGERISNKKGKWEIQ
jgi:hypothetical protein